jgi:hypothetical protein
MLSGLLFAQKVYTEQTYIRKYMLGLLQVCTVCLKFTLSLHVYQPGDFPRKNPG